MNTERTVTVYTRKDCHLCEDAIATVRSVVESVDPSVEIELVDIDQNKLLRAEYGDRVPYVLIDGRPVLSIVLTNAKSDRSSRLEFDSTSHPGK